MTQPTSAPCRLADVIDRYDALFLDVYGVLLNGHGLYDHTKPLIAWLKDTRLPFLLVSNGSSRTLAQSAEAYQAQGVAVSEGQILTSGALLGHWVAAEGLSGQAAHVMGRKASYDVIEQAGLRHAASADEAQVVVILNQADDLLAQVDETLTLIIRHIDQDKPLRLVCPNPDCLYPKDADRFGITAGAIAELLEGALAKRYGLSNPPRFIRLGKPHPLIFQTALAKLEAEWQRTFAPDRVLMIGDQIATDVKGAVEFGLGAMLFQGGVANIDKFAGFDFAAEAGRFHVANDLTPPGS